MGAGRWSREKVGGLLPAALEEEGEDNLVEALGDVDGDVVDAVLHGALLEVGLLTEHVVAVGLRYLRWLQAECAAALEVHEACGPRAVVELQLVCAVEGVEEYDFVLVVAQVSQGVEECFLLAVADEGVGEEDDERATVQLLGEDVQACRERGGAHGALRGLNGLQQAVEEREYVALMQGAGAAGGGGVDGVGDECEAKGIALAVEQLDEYCGGVHAEGKLVGMLYVTLSFKREEHGGALVDDELASEVGLFLELFNVKAVGAAVETPVDVARALAGVVLAVVGEFDGEAVKGGAVTASNKSLDHLACEEVEGFVARDDVRGGH